MGPNEGTAPQCFSVSVLDQPFWGPIWSKHFDSYQNGEQEIKFFASFDRTSHGSLSDAANTSVLVMDIAYKILRNPVLCQRALSSV